MLNILLWIVFIGAIAWLVFAGDWFWRKRKYLKDKKFMAPIIAEISAVAMAALVLFMTVQTNHRETAELINEGRTGEICQHNQVVVNELVELIATLTHQAQYEIGIPEECYADRSGDDIQFKNTALRDAYEKYRTMEAILKGKLQLLLATDVKPIKAAVGEYTSALRTLEKQCRASSIFPYSEVKYREARQHLSDVEASFVQTLASLMGGCLLRQQ